MGLIKLIEGIRKRLMLTNRELDSIYGDSAGSAQLQDNLAKDLQKLTKMMFNDFFLIEGYTDQQYRELFHSIMDTLKENPILTPAQFAHIKRYNDFCRAMNKNLRKYLKENLGDMLEEKTGTEPAEDPVF
ncbi:MAG: hypothetical protein ACTSO9_17110 [Candidatus Helarchaeota archaeon]